MHIPDGFIPLWQCAIYYIIAGVFLFFAFRWSRNNLNEKNIPLIAILAAGIFAIMSINIPVPFGSSGHMVGAAMVAIIFMSPWAGVICIAMVLLVQALFFGDGGVTTYGANVINMGVIGSFVGFYVWQALKHPRLGGLLNLGKYWSIGVAAWIAIFLAACITALELWLAGTFPLGLGLIYMGGYHAMIGILEAIITVIVISTLAKVRPDLLAWNRVKNKDAFNLSTEPQEEEKPPEEKVPSEEILSK
jgi:cobalt/nickel transport system permease protein